MPTSDVRLVRPRWCRAFFWVSVLPLAGCLGEGSGARGVPGLLDAAENDAPKPPHEVTLYSGNVVVAGPAGYCIDKGSLRRRSSVSFVLLASCESLAGRPGNPVQPAVMTVSVLPARPGAQQPDTTGLAASVAPAQVQRGFDGDGLSLVQVSSGGDAYLPGGDPQYWRGAMLINSHLVGLAVYGPRGSKVGGRPGQTMIMALAETLRKRSPAREFAPPPPEETLQSPVREPAHDTSDGLAALLGGLFPNPD